ncbi:helix-turn-helix transcriptional regulator [Streptomyces sp. NPDC002120]|uniref:helix-turn-helix transcriptional regulator n=1 Tax=Streptomyces sp. NPDC002120 TaxID=3364631 RepID=UPI0036BE3192
MRCTRATPHTLAVHLGCDDAEAVESVLNTLVAMGMATADGTDVYRPVAPSTVVARLVERRLKALHEEMRHVSETRDLLESLLREQEFENEYAGSRTEAPLIERLEGLCKVREKLDELSFFCRTELLSTQPGGPMTKDNIAAARPLTEQLLRRGVAMRTIVESGAVADPATAAYLQELTTKGVRIRVVERTAERLLIFDRQTALAPIDPNDSTLGAVAVREPGLVGGMISLFDRIWAESRELDEVVGSPAEGGGPEGGLSELERQILATMQMVDKDEIGAREVGVSVRTYRKYVAALMGRLDAANRFQAALLARDRGWI